MNPFKGIFNVSTTCSAFFKGNVFSSQLVVANNMEHRKTIPKACFPVSFKRKEIIAKTEKMNAVEIVGANVS